MMDTEPRSPVVGETVAVSPEPGEPRRVSSARSRGQTRDEPVHRITDAPAPHSTEMARRMRTYAISMAIRTACVAGFVLVFPHWSAWLFVPGAALLPYVAVLLANAGRESRPPALPRMSHRPAQSALTAAPAGDRAEPGPR